MKVLFITNALTHYYNLVLSKLNARDEIDLVVLAPTAQSSFVGEGVFQTNDGISFKLIQRDEIRKFRICVTFSDLAQIIEKEKPDVIIVNQYYINAFLFDFMVIVAMYRLKIALILKTIPFGIPDYNEAINKAWKDKTSISFLPKSVNRILKKLNLTFLIAFARVYLFKLALKRPDAHINYIDKKELWASYNIDPKKIFITKNSPDTDLLLHAREHLLKDITKIPLKSNRIIHVGRLVGWKKVDLLIKAFSEIKKKFPDSELVIVGAGPEMQSLQALAKQLNVSNSIVFTGGVYDLDILGRYYLSSSLYVLAGMGGLSINEAMCFGLPILCSVCDGTEEYLVNEGVNGKYFQENSKEDLVAKIAWFLENANESELMGKESISIIKNEINIHTVLDEYINAIRYSIEVKKI